MSTGKLSQRAGGARKLRAERHRTSSGSDTVTSAQPGWRRALARFLWAVCGVAATALALGWLLEFSSQPLLGAGALDRPLTCWLSPPADAAALAAWGCFWKASRRGH